MIHCQFCPRVLLAFGLFLMLLVQGCSSLRVESDPPGARVLWSRTGLEPFHPWPPNSWEYWNDSSGNTTPFFARGVYGDAVFVTVEKEGFRRPLPKPVQLYAWQGGEVSFELDELPEHYAERMRTEGRILYRGGGVDRGLEGLVP